MDNIKNIDYNQKLSLKFEIEGLSNVSYYFTVESNYTDKNNVSFEFHEEYDGYTYSKYNFNIFNMDESQANQLFSDIGKAIIKNVKHLNPIKKQEQKKYDKDKKYIKYKIDLLFKDSENIYTKLNLEKIFNSIVSSLKDKYMNLKEKPLDELFEKKKNLRFHLMTKI